MPNRAERRQKLKAEKKAAKKLASSTTTTAAAAAAAAAAASANITDGNKDSLGTSAPAIVLSEAPPRLEPQSVFVDKPPDEMASAEKPTAAAADITNKSAALEEGAQHDTKAAVSGSGGGVSTSISSTQGDTSSAQLATEDVASKPAVADNGENIIKRGSMASGDQTRAEEEQQHDIPTYAETALPLKTGIQETTKDTVAGSKDVSVEPDIPLPEKSAPAQEAQQAPPIPAKVSKSDTRDETSSAAQPSTHDDLPRPKPPPIGKDTAPQALSGAGDVPASLTGQQTEQVPSGAVSAAIGAAVASATVAADTQKRDDKQKGPAVPSPKQAPKPAGSTEAPPPTTPEKDTASVKPPPKDRPKKSGGGFWNLFKSGGSSADKKKSWQFWK